MNRSAGWEHFQVSGPAAAAVDSDLVALSRRDDHLEVWWAGPDASVHGGFWYADGQGWRSPYRVPGPVGSPPQGGIAAASRRDNTMETWWVGADTSVRGAFWYDDGEPWRAYGDPVAVPTAASPNSGMAAVSRIDTSMETWWIGLDGSVQGAFWYEDHNNNEWQRYTLAGFGSAAKSSGIAAVSRKPVAMEIWWVRSDGAVEGAYWYADGDKVWHSYPVAPAGSASQSHSIAAVSRRESSMDVVWITPEGAVQGAYWNEGDDWKLYPETIAENGSASTQGGLATVSRTENSIEVWWIAPDGSVQGACWHDAVGWRRYDEPVAKPGSASKSSGIAAVSRLPTTTEVFWIAPDGSVVVAVRDEQSSSPFSFRIMRPDDLVHLRCDVVGCRIVNRPGPTSGEGASREYIVKAGDTLWAIADKFYGNPFKYWLIADANDIRNPDLIFPDQKLIIPSLSVPQSRPHLVAVEDKAHIVVHFGVQHLYEQAYQGAPSGFADARAANGSRVVFELPDKTEMPFTVAGVLTGLTKLGLRVAPLAIPRVTPNQPRPENAKGPTIAPAADQTAIEAPYRLIVSPDGEYGGFTHASDPATAPDDSSRVELWYSRLGVRRFDAADTFVGVDEAEDEHRTVRAIWARDKDTPTPPQPGFESSLDDTDRKHIVRQSADPTTGVEPVPLSVSRLYLSALGAWIDWRVSWDGLAFPGDRLSAYRHQAMMARDQYVRVEKPIYLFPFGHRGTFVTVTERKIPPDDSDPVAYLRKRNFIVLREHTRSYPGRNMPFASVTINPLVTPDLKPVADESIPFVPELEVTDGGKFRWQLTGVDHVGRAITMTTALVAVPVNDTAFTEANGTWIRQVVQKGHPINVGGADVAFAPERRAGDTTSRLQFIEFAGAAEKETSTPSMFKAHITIPALASLNRAGGPSAVTYRPEYVAGGFPVDEHGEPMLDKSERYLILDTETKLDFAGGSDRGGGFVEPSVSVAALSRRIGAVGDKGNDADGISAGKFDPNKFLGTALPKLFGLFDLKDVLAGGILDRAPKLIGEQLGFVPTVVAEYGNLRAALQQTIEILQADKTGEAPAGAKKRFGELQGLAQQALAGLGDQPIQRLTTALAEGSFTPDGNPARDPAQQILNVLNNTEKLCRSADLAAFLRSLVERRYRALQAVLATATDAAKLTTALLAPVESPTIRYDWFPEIKGWPAGDSPVFIPKDPRGLAISVEVRADKDGKPQSDVSAQLRDFKLELLPGDGALIAMKFGRLGFRVATGGKPEVDVQFDGMEFLGVLGFIEKLRAVIPFDGFSDPPYVDVSPAGATAGFDLALPSLAIGVFSLENVKLGADCRVPFLGEAVTVGFFFCTKEAPFRLTVMAIGGGGWVGIRLAPKGLVLLEMGLEAGASLSVDLGVASGSVSVMIGVYLRLEDTKGQLTGYFRIRGEVEVLGIASASITLELSLTYHFDSGKLIGRATLTVEVEIAFFSASVEITCERQLAGSRGDPALIDVMPPKQGGQALWDQYYSSFAIGA